MWDGNEKQVPPLVAWLREVIDGAGIHKRHEWAAILGTSEEGVASWLAGRIVPNAERLRGIVVLLQERYESRAMSLVARWREISRMTPREALQGDMATSARTIGHYVLEAVWEDLRVAVQALPFEEQANFLGDFLRRTNAR